MLKFLSYFMMVVIREVFPRQGLVRTGAKVCDSSTFAQLSTTVIYLPYKNAQVKNCDSSWLMLMIYSLASQ